jgi:hypothetical protein
MGPNLQQEGQVQETVLSAIEQQGISSQKEKEKAQTVGTSDTENFLRELAELENTEKNFNLLKENIQIKLSFIGELEHNIEDLTEANENLKKANDLLKEDLKEFSDAEKIINQLKEKIFSLQKDNKSVRKESRFGNRGVPRGMTR